MLNPVRTLQQMLYRRGLHVGRVPARSTLRNHLRLMLTELRINLVLDVGANRGDYGSGLREIGYTGRIVSFEPVSATWDELTATRGTDRNWAGMKMALGSADGQTEINLFRGSEFNSLHSLVGLNGDPYRGRTEPAGKETIEVRRLDSVLAECTQGIAEPRILLKIDTQGHDMEVLKGASSSLQAVSGIQSEVAGRCLYADSPHMGDSLKEFHRLGYTPSGFYPVNEAGGLAVIEWDCLLVRDRDHMR